MNPEIYVRPNDPPWCWLRDLHSELPNTPLIQPVIVHTRTRDDSITTPADTTQLAVDDLHHGLDVLYHAEKLWDRCYSYISPLPFVSDDALYVDPPNLVRVWESPNAPEEAPPRYKQGLQLLRNIKSANENRPRHPLVNNLSMKDIMNIYIYDPIDATFQVGDTLSSHI